MAVNIDTAIPLYLEGPWFWNCLGGGLQRGCTGFFGWLPNPSGCFNGGVTTMFFVLVSITVLFGAVGFAAFIVTGAGAAVTGVDCASRVEAGSGGLFSFLLRESTRRLQSRRDDSSFWQRALLSIYMELLVSSLL
jgi:hypothetical protein